MNSRSGLYATATLVAAGMGGVAAVPSSGAPQATTQVFRLDTLRCDQTTEAGRDQVYVIVAGADRRPARASLVRPSSQKNGDIDGGLYWELRKSTRVLDDRIGSWQVLPDHPASLMMVFLESDGANPGSVSRGAAALAAALHDSPEAAPPALLAQLMRHLTPRDRDDLLGALKIHLDSRTGQVSRKYEAHPTTRIEHLSADGFKMVMRGAGAKYEAVIALGAE